ncbi:hypothetical protein ABZO31_04700 [Streptomyces sp. HUAS MG47]|uniref:hypothetical protein n=1 Tax=Streptomyces solicamelliae TaxID=3231716 RepID=UPI0038783FFB
MISENKKPVVLWARGILAAALFVVALFMLALSLPAVGVENTPTGDRDTAAGAFFCLVLSTLFGIGAGAVAFRWTTVRVLVALQMVLVVIIWTQVPSPF